MTALIPRVMLMIILHRILLGMFLALRFGTGTGGMPAIGACGLEKDVAECGEWIWIFSWRVRVGFGLLPVLSDSSLDIQLAVSFNKK